MLITYSFISQQQFNLALELLAAEGITPVSVCEDDLTVTLSGCPATLRVQDLWLSKKIEFQMFAR